MAGLIGTLKWLSRFVSWRKLRRWLGVQHVLLAIVVLVLLSLLQLHTKIQRSTATQEIQPSKLVITIGGEAPTTRNTADDAPHLSRPSQGADLREGTNHQWFSHLRPREFVLPNPEPLSGHLTYDSSVTCLKYGTAAVRDGTCSCHKGWQGKACNIPDCVQHSDLHQIHQLTLRKHLRRIIYAIPFNIEFEMIEALMNELQDLVDVFIVVESPFTAFGTPKPVRLLPKLHRKYLAKFHSKIVYLYMDHFPLGGRKDGWIADTYIRSFLGMKGLRYIHNTRPDDLFIVFDLDEIPSRESLIFLKAHDGYPEPFGFRLRWSVFGFFYKNSRCTEITSGCTVGMLSDVHRNMSNQIRNVREGITNNYSPELTAYRSKHDVRSWFLGTMDHYAGWHCSSCMDIHGIKIKYMSAQNGDFPRWGSQHEKMDLQYIRTMVRNGKWFDGNDLASVVRMEDDPFFAPPYILRNYEKYKYLMLKPDLHDHTHR